MRAALTGLIFAVAMIQGLSQTATGADNKVWLYVGTYTDKDSKGIYRFQFDTDTGEITDRQLAAEAVNPSFLAIHPTRKFLYCVSEVGDVKGKYGKKSGTVHAFGLDPASGKLTALNRQPSEGEGPCHLVVDRQGKNVLVANYGGGNVASLPIKEDGSLDKASSFVQHGGKSADPGRQEGPHAHSINVDPANTHALVADLGLDQVIAYPYDPVKGLLDVENSKAFSAPPGSGPRHLVFHPTKNIVYVINELKNTIIAMSYNETTGALEKIQQVSTLPEGFKGNSYTAEVVAHPDGVYLFGSNRGHDSIATFTIDPLSGKLNPTGHLTKGIKTPRNFNLDPTGKFLLVANQDGGDVVVFRFDCKSGELKPTGQSVKIGHPVCLKFVSMKP